MVIMDEIKFVLQYNYNHENTSKGYPGWNEIDAVQVVGEQDRHSCLSDSLNNHLT